MKFSSFALLAGLTLCLTGCAYRYRVVQPASDTPLVRATRPVTIHYAPLDYRLYHYRERLAMHVTNPTSDRIVLLGNRSFVVDPRGESHPFRDRVIAPHSFTKFLLPPIPFAYAYPDFWAFGPGWGWGWYDPYWGPWWGPGWYGPPPLAYREVMTAYDWEWKRGLARVKLTYERAGKVFEHDFEIVRERDRK